MTRKLFRSFVAMVLAGVTTLAPVAPTFGQAQAPARNASRRQTPGPAHTGQTGQPRSDPAGNPATAPQGRPPAQSPTAPQAVPPFQFAPGRDYSLPRLGSHTS